MSNLKAWLWATGLVLGALLAMGAFIFVASNAPNAALIALGLALVSFAVKCLKNIIKGESTERPV